MDTNCMNVITLAYMGDAIFEVYIREECIKKGFAKVEDLQREVVKYVSAKGQASILKRLIEENHLTDDEIEIVKRGRNYKRSIHPKHTDLATYKQATGFEALIGYLYLSNHRERLEEILKVIEVMPCTYMEKTL